MNKKTLIVFLTLGLILAASVFAQEEGSPAASSCFEIKRSTLNLSVKDTKDYQEKIIKFVQEKNGALAQSNITLSGGNFYGSLAVKIPSENFEEARDYFKGLAEKTAYEQVSTRDFSQEYGNLDGRLKILEETENQLQKLLERKGEISEALEVQKELAGTREAIETIKEKMRCAGEAIITLNISRAHELPQGPQAEKNDTVYVLINVLADLLLFLRWIFYFAIMLIVWSVVWAPLLLLILYLNKRRKKTNQESLKC